MSPLLAALVAALLLALPAAQATPRLPEVWAAGGNATWSMAGASCEGTLELQAIGPAPAGQHAGQYYLTLDAESATEGCPAIHHEAWLASSPREDSTHLLAAKDGTSSFLRLATSEDATRSATLLDAWQTPEGETDVLVLNAALAERNAIL